MSARLIYEVDGEQIEVFNVSEDKVLLAIDKIPNFEYDEDIKQYLLTHEQFRFTVYYNEPINLSEVK